MQVLGRNYLKCLHFYIILNKKLVFAQLCDCKLIFSRFYLRIPKKSSTFAANFTSKMVAIATKFEVRRFHSFSAISNYNILSY